MGEYWKKGWGGRRGPHPQKRVNRGGNSRLGERGPFGPLEGGQKGTGETPKSLWGDKGGLKRKKRKGPKTMPWGKGPTLISRATKNPQEGEKVCPKKGCSFLFCLLGEKLFIGAHTYIKKGGFLHKQYRGGRNNMLPPALSLLIFKR